MHLSAKATGFSWGRRGLAPLPRLVRAVARRFAAPASGEVPLAVVAHHLRLFGLSNAVLGEAGGTARLRLVGSTASGDAVRLRRAAEAGDVVLALMPSAAFCYAFGVRRRENPKCPPVVLRRAPEGTQRRLRSLHATLSLTHPAGSAVVADESGNAVWLWLPVGGGGVLFIGTDMGADLVRYRQGDPAAADNRPAGPLWGFEGERPLYLFEEQLAGELPDERHADNWAMTLAEFAAARLGRPLAPILPGGAAGAIVLTGDDDQAVLEKYDEQLDLLDGAPITYFLHPQTRHTRETLAVMQARYPRLDLGLHPDALHAPTEYADLFARQAAWFHGLTGRSALSVRNHGFLNDGYWGHLPAWRGAGIRVSANLPGLDGRILNGSLLPARVVDETGLTEHWSILTAIGDGVLFIRGMDQDESAQCVLDVAQRIRDSGIPGVLVLNLHPENVSVARGLHRAALATIESGFLAWTMRQCLDWFERVDAPEV